MGFSYYFLFYSDIISACLHRGKYVTIYDVISNSDMYTVLIFGGIFGGLSIAMLRYVINGYMIR